MERDELNCKELMIIGSLGVNLTKGIMCLFQMVP